MVDEGYEQWPVGLAVGIDEGRRNGQFYNGYIPERRRQAIIILFSCSQTSNMTHCNKKYIL